MLLQSHKSFIEIFPAVPYSWKNVSFKTLRTEGAFLISAKKENGVAMEVKIKSEAGGVLRIKLPFTTWINTGIDRSLIKIEKGIAEMMTSKGQTIVFKNGYE
jgi:alpha-L-fucosidase 2